MSGTLHQRRPLPWMIAVALSVSAACTGAIGDRSTDLEAAFGSDGQKPGSGGLDGPGGDGDHDGDGLPDNDVGRVGLHRLNNTEYDHTVQDLLGVGASPAPTFIADEKAAGFDNIASALGMTAARYEQYFQSADQLVEEVWQSDALRGRIVTCTPAAGDAGVSCARQVLRDFGLRAYRRPLTEDEVERLLVVVDEAQTLGEPFDRTLAQAVKTTLSSPSFLFRVELDANPSSEAAHPLTAYELASRLSYLLWTTMPDARLFELAADDSLLDDAVLIGEVDRMLDDPRAERFVESFGGQWLGLKALASHQVDPDVFPVWTDTLRDAMVREGLAYFDEFLHGARGMDTFFSADVSFVDDELASLYDFTGGPFSADTAHSVIDDERRGFLGLSALLTLSSFSYRTAPTLRGKWVLENLLCTEIAPPPANVPQLDDAMTDAEALASQNVRVRLAEHRRDPTCASCHKILDPIGFGLERFDGIGAYRELYDNGDAIDATGELPDGQTFDGLIELSEILGDDPRLLDCTTEKLLTYALGRELSKADKPHVEGIRDAWVDDGLGVRALIERIVLSEPFRMRRGESGS